MFQHACYRCQHACSSSQHAILQKSHVNIMAGFSMASQNSNMAFHNFNMAFQNFNMVFQNSEHGVSKLRTWRFTRCRARTSNDAVEGKGVGQWLLRLTPVYLPPQKKSPHGLHHLLGFLGFLHHKRLGRTLRGRALPTATSLVCPAWQRVPRGAASDSLRFTCASCQPAFDASNTTLTLLGLELQLPRYVFCSLADALEAARHNPLAFLHLANPRTFCLVLHHQWWCS